MHPHAMGFLQGVKVRFPAMFRAVKVVEVGAYNVNGSARDLFADAEYVGIDIRPGPGVDLVGWGHELVGKGPYDVAVSTETLEHDPHAEATVAALVAGLRPGGLLIITAAGPKRQEHGREYADHYENMVAATLGGWIAPHMSLFSVEEKGEDVRAWGVKR